MTVKQTQLRICTERVSKQSAHAQDCERRDRSFNNLLESARNMHTHHHYFEAVSM